MCSLIELLERFGVENSETVPINTGHINSTYMVTSPENRYILQSVSGKVFHDPEAVMRNITRLMDIFQGEELVKIPEYLAAGGKFFVRSGGEVWRMYRFTESAGKIDRFQQGFAIGRFIQRASLANFQPEQVLEGFHDYRSYFQKYEKSGGADPEFSRIGEMIGESFSGVKKRVIHGDAKADNIIFGEIPTVIDLDTVMLHYCAIDYGDMVRSAEDMGEVREITAGFAKGLGGLLTPAEVQSLYFGALWVTAELAMRYSTDALTGEGYFGKSREDCEKRCSQLRHKLEWLKENEKPIREIILKCFG